MDMQPIYTGQCGGGEAIAPPFCIIPYCFGKVGGGVMCHMYACKKPRWHGPILTIYKQPGREGLVEQQALVAAIIPGLTTYLYLFTTPAARHV